MENLLWTSIFLSGFWAFYILKLSHEIDSMKKSISDLNSSMENIDAKTDYIQNIQDDISVLSEKIDPKDPDAWMSKV